MSKFCRRILVLLCCILSCICPRHIPAAASTLYVINDHGGTTISRISSTGTISTFVTGLNNAQDLTFDRAGNLYVSVLGDHAIEKITSAGVISTYATGFVYPWDLAFDHNGNLYVSDFFGGSIKKIAPNGTVSTYLSGIDRPDAIAFNANGTFYYGTSEYNDPTSGMIWKVSNSGIPSLFASSHDLYTPYKFAFDSQGNLYVATGTGLGVQKVTPDGTETPFGFSADQRTSSGLAFNDQGNLFVTDSGDGEIYKDLPNGSSSLFAQGLITPIGMAIASDAVPEIGRSSLAATIIMFMPIVLCIKRRRILRCG